LTMWTHTRWWLILPVRTVRHSIWFTHRSLILKKEKH